MEPCGPRQGIRRTTTRGSISLHATACGYRVGNDHFASPACLPACKQAKAFFPLFFSQRRFPAADDRQRKEEEKKKEALGFERLKPWRLTRLGRLLRGQFSLPAHCSPFPMLLSALLKTYISSILQDNYTGIGIHSFKIFLFCYSVLVKTHVELYGMYNTYVDKRT